MCHTQKNQVAVAAAYEKNRQSRPRSAAPPTKIKTGANSPSRTSSMSASPPVFVSPPGSPASVTAVVGRTPASPSASASTSTSSLALPSASSSVSSTVKQTDGAGTGAASNAPLAIEAAADTPALAGLNLGGASTATLMVSSSGAAALNIPVQIKVLRPPVAK
ncbi:hypothetical protein OC834_003208 [Tilletia horrida]|uniref:Uncharacterized protein n=1 Tax=Tilletia horrida TaxID=155126 RepID=A0AAN6GEV1_9BASI|nr:hypothetical protein OC834_003208 [Tilletia horrida]KAK0533244.1 hypothetical protein OC842_003028 [Tilletia horrida]KAK0534027.1 hypothetical protein OC835_002817 [Tilletia horrida]KAK0563441.1 hypothetical protein OC844_002216 [Tilletia horrida]